MEEVTYQPGVWWSAVVVLLVISLPDSPVYCGGSVSCDKLRSDLDFVIR